MLGREVDAMTEAEWLACTDPTPMLQFPRPRASDRKLRLFAVACCRRIWNLLTEERSRKAVETSEQCADGLASEQQRQAARSAAPCPYPPDDASAADPTGEYNTAYLAAVATAYSAASASCAAAYTVESPTRATALDGIDFICIGRFAAEAVAAHSAAKVAAPTVAHSDYKTANALTEDAYERAHKEEQQHQSALLQDIFGDPFRPVSINPAWRTPNIINVAQAMYDQRAFDRMPELADGLERAGCTDAEILSHCRRPGPHVRGCWIVDLLLGRE
jgi:hypothetical protein